ncbi:actin-binding protein WASF3 [Eurosta solidaginis]|uniref:actin-binding protein WASF3 n=1 Tax=Eurosta solidaginis TaxID=178769 RepID=UPI00353124E3
MPLPKRSLEPVYVSRSVYLQDELQLVELETVTNTALTNIIRQLSSLSKHAEDIFGELASDVGNISNRANSLQARIDHLSIKVTQLDSTMEDVPLTDITRKKGFRSTKIFDQKIFSHSTMPAPMLETYTMCDKPPPLNKLNSFRDDGKDGLKFYTDPNYFFELWRQEMLKDTERVMHDKGKKLNRPRQEGANSCANSTGIKKRVRKPHNTREKQRLIVIDQGETLMPNNINYQTPYSIINMETGYGNFGVFESRQQRPNSIDLRSICNSDLTIDGCRSPNTEITTPHNAPVSTHVADFHSSTTRKNDNGIFQMHSTQSIKENIQSFYEGELYKEDPQSYEEAGALPTEGNCTLGLTSRMKLRPSQPPPAPPSTGSKNGTPVSSSANTPTRGRNLANNRDILPPPPPVPEGLWNTSSSPCTFTAMNRNTPTGIPLQLSNNSVVHLENSFANINAANGSQKSNYNNLSSSVEEEQLSIISATDAAPPPPPPPPPLLRTESDKEGTRLEVSNADIHKRFIIDEAKQHILSQKRLLPPLYDSRTDLMKAIRHGITLRKVEKSEQKEIERTTALHDVASILARRVAIELSESEESDSEDDSEGWMESIENSA